MQVCLSSGNYRIISSGQSFLFGENKDLKINIMADNGFEFSIVLVFETDDTGEQRIARAICGNSITLSCFNFIDTGTGLSKPILIASIEGKEIWFIFWAYLDGTLDDKVRSVKYTVFMNHGMEDDIVEG